MENQQNPQYTKPAPRIIYQNQKSAGLAAVLAFFFGPLGMLYASFSSAFIMLVINIIVAIFTAGLGLIITIPIGSIWAYSIVNNQNLSHYNQNQ